MDLVTGIRLLKKWLWLMLLGAVLAGGIAFLLRSSQPNKYRASVMIAVGSTLEIPNPDLSFITTGADLARTYVILAKTHEVLDAAIKAGDFPVTTSQLTDMVSAHVIENTPLVALEVTYTDSLLASEMANEIAHQLILKSPSYLTDEQQAQLDIANAEIASLTEELSHAREELRALDSALLTASNPDELRDLREQRYTLTALINEKSRTIAEFTTTVANFENRSNSLTIVERALPPTNPVGFGALPMALVGAVLGIAAAAGTALLIEYFDDSIPTATEAARLLTLPILGTITRFGHRRANYRKRLIAYREPDSPATEGYRALRTNLLYLAHRNSQHCAYIITSPGKGEGKTVTASNLAVTIALTGLRVLLVDADLRNPTVHRVFGLENGVGLSTLALSMPPISPGSGNGAATALRQLEAVIQETDVPGLRVVTSGPTPSNPAELLGSEAMRQWVCHIQSMPDIDVALFDTPPLLSVTDGSALAVSGDLPIILVVHAERTRCDAATTAKEQLEVLGVRVVGVVLNAARPSNSAYYSYRRYGA